MCPAAFLSHGTGVRIPVAVPKLSEGLRPSDSPTASLARAGALAPFVGLGRGAPSRLIGASPSDSRTRYF